MSDDAANLLALTADIVSAHVSNNAVQASEVADLIQSVHGALNRLGQPVTVATAKPEPAVSIRASIKPDYLVCLEDGAKLKMLKRYLRTNYDMTPEQYRAKWGLPKDYPMVAPSYAATRKELAIRIGLGRNSGTQKAVARKAPSATEALKAARTRVGKSADAPQA